VQPMSAEVFEEAENVAGVTMRVTNQRDNQQPMADRAVLAEVALLDSVMVAIPRQELPESLRATR
jgi:hypothetical protein